MQGPGVDLHEGPNSSFRESDHLRLKAAVFNEFSFKPAQRNPLAIDAYKDQVLQILKASNALVVKGFTGCGKTTQVPQFILDSRAATKTPCNIVVTQLRRIAAISAAKRVSQERDWELGTVVGYHVGRERRAKDFTCLTYMTTGCLLEMLVGKKSLSEFTHIILDEVHERDEDTDMLLLLVRKLWKSENSTKVILMSATIDASKFSKYFQAPVINVESAPPFDVEEFFLDDMRSIPALGAYVPDNPREPTIEKEAYECAAKIIEDFDGEVDSRVPEHQNSSQNRGAVLVFLPGLAEIEAMHKQLQVVELASNKKWLILPLHSRITREEQNKIFEVPHSTFRKIILATNVAESSITVPDVHYIVDFCLVRQLVVDEQTNFSTLKLTWAAKSSLDQRQGRIGRVRNGEVYRMISRHIYDKVLDKDAMPEILRCPLEHTILRVKLLDMGEPKALLFNALDRPNMVNIDRTILTLKEVGVLFLTVDGSLAIKPGDGDLSYLGRVIARLPIGIRLGKLIMLGYMFNVLEECIIMAAGLSSKNIFISSSDKKLETYYWKMSFAEGSFSDPVTILNAYQCWKTKFGSNECFRNRAEIEWAKKHNIHLKAMKDMDFLVKEIKFRLKEFGIEPATVRNELSPLQTAFLYQIVLFGAFYPQFFGGSAGQVNEQNAVKYWCGSDPFNTVKLSGWKMDQPGKAYIVQLRNSLDNVLRVLKDPTWRYIIKFDASRVFIQFYQEGNSSERRIIPGRVALPVYLVLKQKRLKKGHQPSSSPDNLNVVGLLDLENAHIYAQQVEELAARILSALKGIQQWPLPDFPCLLRMKPPRLPRVREEEISILICHAEEPNHFWVQRYDKLGNIDINQIRTIIESNLDKGVRFHININQLVLAPYTYTDDGGEPVTEYYRAKIIKYQHDADKVKVYFIDYGNCAEVWKIDLCKLPHELLEFPPLAIESYLSGVGPSLMADPKGHWIPAAHEFIQTFVQMPLKAKIYSVVNGVLSLDARPDNDDDWEHSLCNEMVRRDFAIRIEETYCSRQNREERIAVRAVSEVYPTYQEKEYEASRRFNAELMATEQIHFSGERVIGTFDLTGPNSPLEVKLSGKVKSLAGREVTVDDDSVNSVLLDSTLKGKPETVLVAAQVSSSSDGKCVRVRQTTVLPAMAGLSSILSLLFAPRVEFRADVNRTRLTGALCGLGKKGDGSSIYPAHDMELEFDTEISVKDVQEINKIRYYMDLVLGPEYFGTIPQAHFAERIREYSQKCVQGLFKLLSPRTDVEVVCSRHTHKWNKIEPGHLVRCEQPEDHVLKLLPLHDYIYIVPKTSEGPK